jgi:hypothetical protein
MLNIGPLGGEGVPFFCIVSCSIAKKNIEEWYFVCIKEDERLCSNHVGHRLKETPQRMPLSLYLYHFYTREKREEQPHLLVRFSPIFGFPSHILCLFLDGVIVF